MSGRMEKLLKAYPEMIQKRDCLAYQLAHFKGLSAEDVIDSMMTPKVDGERVKSSRLSDKTAQIALEYRDRQARFNREWYEWLEKQWQLLNDEIVFLESAIRALPERYSVVIHDLFIEQMTWDALQAKHHIGRATLSSYRRKGLQALERLYADHQAAETTFMLS